MRSTEDNIPPPLDANGFVHSSDFLDFEQYKTIGREALMNIGLGFLMIAVVVVFLIANPLASFLTFISVASAILELVGFMYFRGTYIDSVTVIFLVISLGLAVDYSVHVAHGFLANRSEDPVARLEGTMKVRTHAIPPRPHALYRHTAITRAGLSAPPRMHIGCHYCSNLLLGNTVVAHTTLSGACLGQSIGNI